VARALKNVAQRPAECCDHIKLRSFKATEIGHVKDSPRLDRFLESCFGNTIAVQLKLPGRNVTHENPGAESGELDRKTPGAGADLEHPVARMNPTGLKALVKLEAYSAGDISVETTPFGVAVRIEEDAHTIRRVATGHDPMAE
jgi:hypothetical protein